MEVNDGLLTFGAEEEGAVGWVVHEEVFGEDGGAGGVAEEVEVGAEAVAGEMWAGGVVEGGGEGIGPGVATGGVGAPAAGGGPVFAGTGGVAVDGDEEDVVFVPSWRHHSFTRRQRSGRGMSVGSGTRRAASRPRAVRPSTMPRARRRFWAYSRRRPSGLRLPGVSRP